MNKKALVVSAIIGLIIAIGLIFFALKIGSSIFRLSAQAEDGFVSLTNWVKEVKASSNPAEFRKEFFYLDKETYIYMINDVSRGMHITQDPIFGGDVDFYLSTPPQCNENNCLCLCQKYEDETDRNCLKVLCEPLPGVEFSPGTGIVLDRGIEGPRRQEVTIIKCVGGEKYCKNSKPGDISIIFSWPDQDPYNLYAKSGAK